MFHVMATARPSQKKRARELGLQERQREKAARRSQRKLERERRGAGVEGEDPDIAGIRPGPQPPAEDSKS